jgi:DNA-binding MarR family transcriptional regulator
MSSTDGFRGAASANTNGLVGAIDVDAQAKPSPAPPQAEKQFTIRTAAFAGGSGSAMLNAGEQIRAASEESQRRGHAAERGIRAATAQYDRRFKAPARLYVETILRSYPRGFDYRPVTKTARLLGIKTEIVYEIWDKLEDEELIAIERNAWGRGRHLVWPLPRSVNIGPARSEQDKQADFKLWVARFLVHSHEDVALRTLIYLKQKALDGEVAGSFSDIKEALQLTDRSNAARAVRLIIKRGRLRRAGSKADGTRIYRLTDGARITKPVDANEGTIIDEDGLPVEAERNEPAPTFDPAGAPSHDQTIEYYRQQTAQRQEQTAQRQAMNQRRRPWTNHATS